MAEFGDINKPIWICWRASVYRPLPIRNADKLIRAAKFVGHNFSAFWKSGSLDDQHCKYLLLPQKENTRTKSEMSIAGRRRFLRWASACAPNTIAASNGSIGMY